MSRDVFAELADRIHTVAHTAARHHRSAHTFKVLRASPLRIESLDTDLVLDEGDEGFEIEQGVQDYDFRFGIKTGDLVKVTHDGTDYSATGIISDTDISSP